MPKYILVKDGVDLGDVKASRLPVLGQKVTLRGVKYVVMGHTSGMFDGKRCSVKLIVEHAQDIIHPAT